MFASILNHSIPTLLDNIVTGRPTKSINMAKKNMGEAFSSSSLGSALSLRFLEGLNDMRLLFHS